MDRVKLAKSQLKVTDSNTMSFQESKIVNVQGKKAVFEHNGPASPKFFQKRKNKFQSSFSKSFKKQLNSPI